MQPSDLLFEARRAAAALRDAWACVQPDEAALTHLLLLREIARAPGLRPVELGARLHVSKSQVSQWLDQITRHGWVRVERPHRNLTRLHLTPAGRRVLQQAEQAADTLAGYLFGDLPPEDLQAAARVLNRIQERAR